MHDQIVNEIQEEEFFRSIRIVQDVLTATPKMVKTLYKYKHGEEMQQIDISNEVTREFLSGKTDAN